ncbi:tetraacyldisaccharide 4'-kinase [Chitinibacter bivalviorum]|uniref:Tetraacyldisaccharide 4'-kinase n=1 Tax=Chitinibacter bivalviorum TaxID=2739434 RepID=A0A7H9BDV1_9NEIS|nr:tetraacyldisaccharide 4'-kinase [Chitinibacter bivalviorum]QLG86890.1 tetraacyldisaccharide 4'-kinase [Chitinibacter bivalviorum]
MNLESLIHRIWYRRSPSIGAILLWPLSLVFAALAAVNRLLFQFGLKKSARLPVPVVVVGNITVGGTGKTPLTIALARRLSELGWRVGIISRGYGRQGDDGAARTVALDSLPQDVGDEPLLMRRALADLNVPVFVARRRAEAGRALLAANSKVNLIICDDGLQHYALVRDFEICVIDAARGLGNGLRLPAGPLREGKSRLNTVNAVVLNGVLPSNQEGYLSTGQYRGEYPSLHQMRLAAQSCYRLNDPSQTRHASDFAAPLQAVVGIGNPQRFFNTLAELGFRYSEHVFPDHHAFTLADLPPSGEIILTEKDAVKIAALLPPIGTDNATDAAWSDRIWVLPVKAVISPDLAQRIDLHFDSFERKR